MSGSPPHRDHRSQPRGSGSGSYYRDRDRGSLDSYDSYKPQNNSSSPLLPNRRERSPPRRERSPPRASRYERSDIRPQRDRQSGADRRDSRSPERPRPLTKEPNEPTPRTPVPSTDEPQTSKANPLPPSLPMKLSIAGERQIPKTGPLPPPLPTNPSTIEDSQIPKTGPLPPLLSKKPSIAGERQIPKPGPPTPVISTKTSIADVTPDAIKQASQALSLTLSETLAQLCNSNIGIMTSILEKQKFEQLQKDAKSPSSNPKILNPHGARFPAMERRAKKNANESDMKWKSICATLEQRQATLKSDCERIAANIVPKLLAATQDLQPKAQNDDTIYKDELENLSKRCDTLDTELTAQKGSLANVNTIASNVLNAYKSQDENSKSSAENQKSELSELRRQQKESLEKSSELEKRLVRAEEIIRNHSTIETKISETESSLSELRARQNQAEEVVSKHKSKFEEHFKDFSNFQHQAGKQISERKSAGTQANAQQSLDALNGLSGRVDVLERNQAVHSAAVEGYSTRVDTLLDQVGDLLSGQGSDSTRLTDLFDKVQGVSVWQKEVNLKLAATKEELKKLDAEVASVQGVSQTGVSTWQREISSKFATAATKEDLQKVNAKMTGLQGISTWQSEINSKLATVPTRKELKEVEDKAAATAKLLDNLAHKSSTEIQSVKTSVYSSVNGQSKTLDTLKGQMASQEKKASLNDDSLRMENFTNELADVKKDIERLKSQSQERSQSTTARVPTENTTSQRPNATSFKAALEDANDAVQAQFEALEDTFGEEVNKLKETCKALENDFTRLKEAEVSGGEVNKLKATCKALENEITKLKEAILPSSMQLQKLEGQIDQHGNQFSQLIESTNQLKESTDYLRDSCQANGHAFVNLESRYNNLTTGDIYQAIAHAFSEDMYPKFAQFPEYAKYVEQLHMRTLALESVPTRSVLDDLSLTVDQIRTRLGELETTTQEGIDQHRNEVRTQLDSFKVVMASKLARIKNVNDDTPEENDQDAPSNGIHGGRKRFPTQSPGPSLSNGTRKKQKVAPEESEEQSELD